MSGIFGVKRSRGLRGAVALRLCGVAALAQEAVALLLSLGEESSPADKPLPFPERGR